MNMETYEQYKQLFGIEAFQGDFEALTEQFRLYFSLFHDYIEAAGKSVSKLVVSDGMTVVIGISVVLATLLVLTAIFYLFGFVMDKINQPKKSKTAAPAKAEAPVKATPTAPAKAPVVQSGIPGEVVAAIAAAVAMMAPEGKRYAVKSVSRKDAGGRSAWAAAGVADNTRPF